MTPAEKMEHVLAFVGALVPLMSALASLINHVVRERQAKGEAVSPVLLQSGALLNVGAINLDKAVQMATLAKEAKGKKREG
jgi:hypothetical protein